MQGVRQAGRGRDSDSVAVVGNVCISVRIERMCFQEGSALGTNKARMSVVKPFITISPPIPSIDIYR